MPDWTYRPLLKPVLRALPRARTHVGVLRCLAVLARMPGGPRILEFFGHMRPDPRLEVAVGGLSWSTPIGIGASLDPLGIAGRAWERFGVGFVEVGAAYETLPENLPAWVRVAATPLDSLRQAIVGLPASAVGIVLEQLKSLPTPLRSQQVRDAVESLRHRHRAGLVLVAIDVRDPSEEVEMLASCALAAGADGVRLDSGWNPTTDSLDSPAPLARERMLASAKRLRACLGHQPMLIAGGAETPADVLALRGAGVGLVVLDAGLVRSGPGLPKRVNAALLFQATATAAAVAATPAEARGAPRPWSRYSWFWCALLGGSMVLGGLLAAVIASTRVVLPYDEVWCSTTRAGFVAINPRLLPFMAHDRVTLAGTMISIGGSYFGLAVGAVRRGAHWAKKSVIASAVTGFLSFFLFLGFGYFDPFHAFVTAILFQILVMALYAPLGTPQAVPFPELEESAAWRRGQWGQLLFVLLGLGLTGAGAVIAFVGIQEVFVREDLQFLRTSLAALRSANPRLISLVAHDRASLGGMLIANGLVVWLAAQWGFVGGARWLWWTFVLSGIPAFAGAIGVHLAVGYTNLWHLAPAFLALAVFILGAGLTRGWLCAPEAPRRLAWREYHGS